ncbi:MAG: Cof-type HAD-IIB family hydrolase [Spirochaetia bacterium]|nr:Cof-type HAD-IIB family hydrolase [Spirochaetia bacterium]
MPEQNLQIKAVFFDVDGTLLSHTTKSVPKSTRDAIFALQHRKIKAIVCTGRDIGAYAKLPMGDIHFDGYLTLNGNLLMDSRRKIYAGIPIDKGDMEVLAQTFRAKKIPFALIARDRVYINYVDETVIKTQDSQMSAIPKVGKYNGEKIYQILAFVPEHEQHILSSILDDCKINSWNDTGIDIIPANGGKDVGIRKYMELHKLDSSQIMAFGDSENDIEMLKLAGIGVAMGNATDDVKAVADYVTASVDEDGIKKALMHFGLI